MQFATTFVAVKFVALWSRLHHHLHSLQSLQLNVLAAIMRTNEMKQMQTRQCKANSNDFDGNCDIADDAANRK